MLCRLDKPTACYNCPYPECLDYSNPTKEETALLKEFIPDRKIHRTDARRNKKGKQKESRDRSEYFKQYRESHKEELKEYQSQYYERNKVIDAPDISAWDTWGIGFYVGLNERVFEHE